MWTQVAIRDDHLSPTVSPGVTIVSPRVDIASPPAVWSEILCNQRGMREKLRCGIRFLLLSRAKPGRRTSDACLGSGFRMPDAESGCWIQTSDAGCRVRPLLHIAPRAIRSTGCDPGASRERRKEHHGPMELSAAMTRSGHLASRQQLAAVRIGRHVIDRGLREGGLLPVRPGWVATPQADQLAIIAVLHGARLTGATALRSYGIWAGDDRRIHLQLPPNAHRVQQRPLTPIARFTASKFIPHGVVRHWGTTLQNFVAGPANPTHPAQPGRSTQLTAGVRMADGPQPTGVTSTAAGPTTDWRVSMADAIIRFAAKESDEQIVAAMESAVHTRRLSRAVVMSLFQWLPRRQRRLAARLNFLGESGMETIVRMRLESLGLHVVQQVRIGGDRVDLVIDGWLIIELDGDEWHNPVDDRIRTNRLIRAGYRMLRFGYQEVFERWDETVATILEMLGVPTSV